MFKGSKKQKTRRFLLGKIKNKFKTKKENAIRFSSEAIKKIGVPYFEEVQKKPGGFFYLQTSIPKSDISLEEGIMSAS